jgi:hypothetical protein
LYTSAGFYHRHPVVNKVVICHGINANTGKMNLSKMQLSENLVSLKSMGKSGCAKNKSHKKIIFRVRKGYPKM